MTMPTPPTGTWRVTSQGPPTNKVDAAGNLTEGITVYFTTGAGVASSVFVPDGVYSPDNVKQLVAGKAAQLDAVAGLSGE